MNTLFYSYNFLPKDGGGIEKYLISLVQRLKKGDQIILVLPQWQNI